MRTLFGLLLVLGLGVLVALLALDDPGFVVVGRGGWSLETSLSVFLLLQLLGFAVLYALLRLGFGLWRLPSQLLGGLRRNRQEKAQQALMAGCSALLERQWQPAEQAFTRAQPGFLHYLGAAWAAQQRVAIPQRDRYLDLAHAAADAEHSFNVDLLRAELYLQNRQYPDALGLLLELRATRPGHPWLLSLLQRAYQAQGSWDKLYALLPELRKHKALATPRLETLETESAQGLLGQAAQRGASALAQHWEGLPKLQRLNPGVVRLYATHLLHLGQDEAAEPVLREALKQRWDSPLVKLYGHVQTDPAQQLKQAEKWFKDHPDDPMLLLTLGRLCTRNRLWGKAQQYLESSLRLQAAPDTYQALGELQSQLGEQGRAAEYYLQGLQWVVAECERRQDPPVG